MGKTIYTLVGPQSSGKTHWAKNAPMAHDQTIVRISQDEQGRVGHLDLFRQSIGSGMSIVVDSDECNIVEVDCGHKSSRMV